MNGVEHELRRDMAGTVSELGRTREELHNLRHTVERIRNIMRHAAIDDDEGDTDALRVALGKIASLVGVDWTA